MSIVGTVSYSAYIEARAILSANDSAYRVAIAILGRFRAYQARNLARRDTTVVIDGFQRSANTFFFAHFSLAQDGHARIAHHLHEAYQIRFAEEHNIPCVVLLREPLSAVVSSLMRDGRPSPASLLRNYIRFYREVARVRSRSVVAKFETVTTHPNSVITAVNLAYGTRFALLPDSRRGEVKELVAALDRDEFPVIHSLQLASPSPEKAGAAASWSERIIVRHRTLLTEARQLHDNLAVEAI